MFLLSLHFLEEILFHIQRFYDLCCINIKFVYKLFEKFKKPGMNENYQIQQNMSLKNQTTK